MGRLINFDAEVQTSIDEYFRTKSEHAGLIVGQRTTPKDIAIRLCPVTPEEDDNQKSDETKESKVNTSSKKSTPGKNSKAENSIDLDEIWISQFSKEVTRTLPGGFEVLGLYFVAPSESANKLNPKLRQVLFSISNALSKDHELSINPDVKERVLLHVCTDVNKFVCRTYDVSNTKSTPNPAEWKPSSTGATTWLALKSQLAIDLKCAIKNEDHSFSIKDQIDSSLVSFFANVQNAVAVINNSLRNPEELLDSSFESKKSKKQQQKQPSQNSYNVDLLFQLEPSKKIIPSVTFEGIMMLTFKGNIQSRGFVHNKATVKEAVQAIKQDIIRSITARCEIHCEDLLVIDEENQDPVVVYELPKRVFAPLPQKDLLVCDYQFHGDKASDSLNAFKELLNLELDEQDIETTCEVSPVTSALIQPDVMEDRLSEFGDNPSPKTNVFFPVASAAVAAVAAGLSYFLLLQDT